jgi:hypothetical protein
MTRSRSSSLRHFVFISIIQQLAWNEPKRQYVPRKNGQKSLDGAETRPLLETNDIENVWSTDGTHEDHGNGEGQEARSSDDGWMLVRRGK